MTISQREYQRLIGRSMSEAELMELVIEQALTCGWIVAHINDRMYSLAIASGRPDVMAGAKGLPDLIMARSGRVIFVELKSKTGKVRPDQQMWLDELQARVPDATHEVYTWRPADWQSGEIERVLLGTR